MSMNFLQHRNHLFSGKNNGNTFGDPLNQAITFIIHSLWILWLCLSYSRVKPTREITSQWMWSEVTSQLLSDLPLQTSQGACRWRALFRPPGNRFPFHQSWRRWTRVNWRGTCPSSAWSDSPPFDYRGRHTCAGEQWSDVSERLVHCVGMERWGVLFTYTSIRRGYFLDFLKFGGNIIWYQRSVGKKISYVSVLRWLNTSILIHQLHSVLEVNRGDFLNG